MKGNSPLTQQGNKLILLSPDTLQRMTAVVIIIDIVLIPFSILLYPTTDEAKYIIIFFWISAFILTFANFGFKSRFIFDSTKKQIFLEGTSYFRPYTKLVCNYSDVSLIGIQYHEYRGKNSTIRYYDLVYEIRPRFSEFHLLATTGGVRQAFSYNELQKLGQLLSKTLDCPFKPL